MLSEKDLPEDFARRRLCVPCWNGQHFRRDSINHRIENNCQLWAGDGQHCECECKNLGVNLREEREKARGREAREKKAQIEIEAEAMEIKGGKDE